MSPVAATRSPTSVRTSRCAQSRGAHDDRRPAAAGARDESDQRATPSPSSPTRGWGRLWRGR